MSRTVGVKLVVCDVKSTAMRGSAIGICEICEAASYTSFISSLGTASFFLFVAKKVI